MVEFVLTLWLCSTVPGTDCKVVPTQIMTFEDHYSCIVYGYDYSYKLITGYNKEWVNSMGAYTKFTCEPKEISSV